MRIIGLITFFSLLVIQHPAFAQLKGDPGIPCFRMENGQVVEIDNPLSMSPFADIAYVEAVPSWVSELDYGQSLHLSVSYRVAHCRPFNIFAEPVLDERVDGVIQFTSPSKAYSPGEHQGKHTAFVGFRLANDESTIASQNISGVRIKISEYGSYKILAEKTLPLSVFWQLQSKSINETKQCMDVVHWSTGQSANRSCTNSAQFGLREGFKIADQVDLNYDGICELIVEVESCRKLNNNTCYKVFAEQDGYFQEIWQYYNELRLLEPENGFNRLGSTETGPQQDVHRLGRYDPLQSRYVTQYFLTPCL